MATTHTNVRDGKRVDITVEFVSRRTLELGGQRVQRLLVVDTSGERFPVLVVSGGVGVPALQFGKRYRLGGLLGAVTGGSAASGLTCAGCGERLQQEQAAGSVVPVIVRAAGQFGIDGVFGIADRLTSVERSARETGSVDDWQVLSRTEAGSRAHVCTGCGRYVGARGTGENTGVVWPAVVMPDGQTGGPGRTSGDTSGSTSSLRKIIENGYTPQPTAIIDKMLYGSHQLDTPQSVSTGGSLELRHGAAVVENPLDGGTERYVAVQLDTPRSDVFERPQVDLAVVLDVSDSMGGPVDGYYYGGESGGMTKLEVATRGLCALTRQLCENDRLAVVLCNQQAAVAKPLDEIASTDTAAIRRHIQEIACGGDTDLADGVETAIDVLESGTNPRSEQRVLLVTDTMPNTGSTRRGALARVFADAATDGIHTTLVGVGIDANAELASVLSGVRGANRYFVRSAEQFERLLTTEFDRMVTPLGHDLTLELADDSHEIAAVHGSPPADAATDRLVYVGTVFPTHSRGNAATCGLVLARLTRTAATEGVELVVSWTERGGGERSESVCLSWPDEEPTGPGVRTVVTLARYTQELRQWAADCHDRTANTDTRGRFPDRLGEHCNGPTPLDVPERYARRFDRLADSLQQAMDRLGEPRFKREVALLESLCAGSDSRDS